MNTLRTAVVFGVTAVLFSFGFGTSTASAEEYPTYTEVHAAQPATDLNTKSFARKVVARVNDIREAHGLDDVARNRCLGRWTEARIADIFGEEMLATPQCPIARAGEALVYAVATPRQAVAQALRNGGRIVLNADTDQVGVTAKQTSNGVIVSIVIADRD